MVEQNKQTTQNSKKKDRITRYKLKTPRKQGQNCVMETHNSMRKKKKKKKKVRIARYKLRIQTKKKRKESELQDVIAIQM